MKIQRFLIASLLALPSPAAAQKLISASTNEEGTKVVVQSVGAPRPEFEGSLGNTHRYARRLVAATTKEIAIVLDSVTDTTGASGSPRSTLVSFNLSDGAQTTVKLEESGYLHCLFRKPAKASSAFVGVRESSSDNRHEVREINRATGASSLVTSIARQGNLTHGAAARAKNGLFVLESGKNRPSQNLVFLPLQSRGKASARALRAIGMRGELNLVHLKNFGAGRTLLGLGYVNGEVSSFSIKPASGKVELLKTYSEIEKIEGGQAAIRDGREVLFVGTTRDEPKLKVLYRIKANGAIETVRGFESNETLIKRLPTRSESIIE